MRQHTKWLRLLAILLGLSLFAAACGDDEDDSSGDESTEEGSGDDEGDGGEEEEDPAIAALREVGDADPDCESESDGTFRVGGLLAETGDLGDVLGAPQAAGATLAVQDINAAGGVLGKDIVYEPKDSGDADPDLATPAVAEHLQAGVDAILGASASQISSNQIDTIVGECTIMFSPSNTGPVFTTYDDNDLYFRTAAADILQGRVIAELAIEEGNEEAVIMARQDPYGEGLLTYIKSGFEEAGGEITGEVIYDPEATEFDTEIGEVVEADPDALFLVGFNETSTILSGLIEEGFTPEEKSIYFIEGNMGNAVGEAFTEQGVLTNIKGTIPGASVSDEFQNRMLEVDAGLGNFTYGPETYDALVILALAANAAGTDESAAVARKINSVTRDGEKCTTYADCLALLQADPNADIDYDGQSGPVDFAKPGEPTAANYGIYTWNEDNTVNTEALEFKDVSL
ncbi:MAG TPA: ABC transporter substrate-binding protein [Acidimicrobiales bacterium]